MSEKSSKIKYWLLCLRILKQDKDSFYCFKRVQLSIFFYSGMLSVPYN